MFTFDSYINRKLYRYIWTSDNFSDNFWLFILLLIKFLEYKSIINTLNNDNLFY